MKLYVEKEKIKGERITTFLKRCYDINTTSYFYNFTKTYFDENYQNQQCRRGNRSFEDLYSVIKTYYPNCSKKHFAKQLEKVVKTTKLRFLFCPDIHKWVLMYIGKDQWDKKYKYLFNYHSSNAKLDKKGKGEYTYYNIMSLMGYSKGQCKI
jgi:hypothetical protein